MKIHKIHFIQNSFIRTLHTDVGILFFDITKGDGVDYERDIVNDPKRLEALKTGKHHLIKWMSISIPTVYRKSNPQALIFKKWSGETVFESVVKGKSSHIKYTMSEPTEMTDDYKKELTDALLEANQNQVEGAGDYTVKVWMLENLNKKI